ncbi:UDP-N-acetylglucosamine-N-acetylmuramyl-pyrophosphoryl-undecaprenol N-acetylglucosamine protein [Melia azedarach]|uniref:UDP-N-acetylglucosamine-N-acetylmuramyl-pyrophosphoryl-undecaprenol N-acetylglucosamine protein n=1 Tax=Melia azedarach TaxID=155640 RepID=A0ACC1Z0I3_MELAZ|nr:UDP-N-acetylglucosamine-N-acetylmuramyl-pyrophosphoryl-undecaprenol N-acetylglucosamine protein [Melia azedarach]
MQALVAADTTALSYWFNWKVLICAIWILSCMVTSLFIIWKYECFDNFKSDGGETQQDADNVWRPSLKQVHPFWLFLFRVTAFCLLLVTLIIKVNRSGGSTLFFYTQWTLILVTIYFGFGSLLSLYGCYRDHKRSSGTRNVHHDRVDAEQGSFMPLTNGESTSIPRTREVSISQEEFRAPGIICYLFQVIFQMSAGAVTLTDFIYWSVIFPFLTIKDYKFKFMTVIMHTLNAVLLLGDTALNCLQFPWFRISYFVLWTCAFVIFQWILHGCVSIWWPYAFLDLSSPYAPLWYLLIGLVHIPCYGLFALIVKMKHYLLSKWFPQSYRCLR